MSSGLPRRRSGKALRSASFRGALSTSPAPPPAGGLGRLDAARRHGIDTDAVGTPLERGRTGERDQGRLGRGVGHPEGHGGQAGHRAHGHDAATATPGYELARHLAHRHAARCAELSSETSSKTESSRSSREDHCCGHIPPCHVHQTVQSSEGRGLGYCRGDVGDPAHVGDHQPVRTRSASQRILEHIQCLGPVVQAGHRCPLLGQQPAHGRADAPATGAGDDDVAALETEPAHGRTITALAAWRTC